jgi:type VI secretion system protein ImpL
LRQLNLSRWLFSLLGVELLCGTVWFLGPLLPWLEGWPSRAAIAVTLLALWFVVNFFIERQRGARDRALTDGIVADTSAPSAPMGRADTEKAAVESKIGTALALLKGARGTRGYLYERPWYVIIGPPGAGKTTALLNAGLEFPLAGTMGQGAIAGVGGTRLCEWWFTDQAVLIDTAGRFTTQDSDAAVDRAGWDAFLELLKRTRPRQPLNGVIIAIALSDIALGSAAERSANARAIRQRIDELESRFELHMPVYAVFTKADLLAGFMEFFDDLDSERRGQVWGTTFPQGATAREIMGGFSTAFRQLTERLGVRLLDRLQAEPNAERRALLAGFPTQVASLEAPLTEFLAEAFGEVPSRQAPMLRGVYLTSATQEGTPIDRLTGAIARAFGLDPQRAARQRPQDGRSYFLGHLLRDVVFNEAMLVTDGEGRRRRGMMVTAAGLAIGVLLAASAAGALWLTYAAGQRSIATSAEALAAYEQVAARLPLDPVGDADLASLMPLLDQARSGAAGIEADRGANTASQVWWSLLSQEGKLIAGRRALYRHALEHALLPRLIWRLEAQLRGNLTNPEFLYEATRVYLMLGGAGPLDRDLVREWMALDWQVTWPGPANEALRVDLARHLDVLLADPLTAVPLDGELVSQARATLGRISLAQRIYFRIRPSAAAQGVPPWRPSDALGAAGVGVFMRASGRPLDDGIPGFFTVDGFHKVLLPALGRAAQEVAQESWVLGQTLMLDPRSEQMRAVEHDVIALYEADYAKAWDAMLADLNLAPLRSLTQAAQDLYIVASQHSPMRALLLSAARQLTLSVPPGTVPKIAQAAPLPAVSDTGARLQVLFGTKPETAAAAAMRPGHEIDERYKPLRDLVGSAVGAPIDQVMKSLTDLQQQLAKLAAAGLRGATTVNASDDPALALRAEAQRQPQPLSRWLATAAASGMALRGGDAKQQVIAAYNIAGGPAAQCALAVNGRYPFTPGSSTDISIEDFSRIFAPGGVLDGFFNTLLKPYVDTSGRVWKPQSPEGVVPPVAAAELGQFQRAAQIRDLFFASGRASPDVRFDITPIRLDPRATRMALDLDGTALTYTGGPPRSTEITWPGANPTQTARLGIDPPPSGGVGVWQESGSWALFRLFGRGRLVSGTTAERSTLIFQMGERQAVFDIRTGAGDPLVPGVLQAFRCPQVQ